jgi:uncharacterized membrane protein YobD (UPF0266 family)
LTVQEHKPAVEIAKPGSAPEQRLPAPSGRMGRRCGQVLEFFVAGVLVLLFAMQLMHYPVQGGDPDGYVTLADHVAATHQLLPGSARMPGYPVFLALASGVLGMRFNEAGYWFQIGLALILAVGSWWFVRQVLGRRTALVFLLILATPNFLARIATMTLSDFLFAAFWVPFSIGAVVWLVRPGGRRTDALSFVALIALLFVLQAVRPSGVLMTGELLAGVAVAVVVAALLRWPAARGVLSTRRFWLKTFAMTVAMVVVFVAEDLAFGAGVRDFNALALQYRIVLALPAASAAPEDQQVEAIKERYRQIEGEPVESSRGVRRKDESPYPSPAQVSAVWSARLAAHPWLYVSTIVRDLKLNHFIVARYYVPFLTDSNTFSLPLHYPMDDGSFASNVFRSTGLSVPDGYSVLGNDWVVRAVVEDIGQLFLMWGTLALGIWALLRRHFFVTVGLLVAAGLYTLMLAATVIPDPRYMLPFAVPCYIAQARGITYIFDKLVAA